MVTHAHRWRHSPLVLIRQSFGSLVFERCTGRYLPFDQESTNLLLDLTENAIDGVIARRTNPKERQDIGNFYERFYDRGFFTLDGRFDGEILPIASVDNHLTGPLAVHLEMTTACNLRCRHCFAGKPLKEGPLLGMAELDALFSEMARLGSYRLGLTGGEPLLREDLFDIIDLALDHGLSPCVTTNGTLLDERISREFGRRKLLWLNVSLEGATASTNDQVRGPGSFSRVLANVRVLANHSKFSLAFTVMRTNLRELKPCADLAREIGAQSAVFRPLYPVGTAQQNLQLMPSFAEYCTALEAVLAQEDARVDQDCTATTFNPTVRQQHKSLLFPVDGCGAGNVVCSISSSGDISPCSFLGPDFIAGNIRNSSLGEIWRSTAFNHFRTVGANGALFKGGCRARALWLNGSVHAMDPWINGFTRTGLHDQSQTVVV